MHDVSISVVTYNNENSVKKALESIVASISGKLDYMIYVIDNCSKDKTVEIAKKVLGNIKIIQLDKNVGFGAGHNVILNELDSRYHVVVNPDIEIVNDCILQLADYMDKYENVGLLSPMIKYLDGEIQYLCKRNPTFLDLLVRLAAPRFLKKRQNWFVMKETGYNKEFEVEYATGCFMFFRTEIFKKINGFDEKIFLYLEDADITRRVNQISRTVFYPKTYVVHEWQRGAHKNLKLMWINIQSAFYYFKKWGWKLW